jgi:hypothetical protein
MNNLQNKKWEKTETALSGTTNTETGTGLESLIKASDG